MCMSLYSTLVVLSVHPPPSPSIYFVSVFGSMVLYGSFLPQGESLTLESPG